MVHNYTFEGIAYTGHFVGHDVTVVRDCDNESWTQPIADLPAPLIAQLLNAGVIT